MMTDFTEYTEGEYFDAIAAGHKEADALRALADRIEALGSYYSPDLSIHEAELRKEAAELSLSDAFAATICKLFEL